MAGMMHWRVSSAANVLMLGRYEPICARVYRWPDCGARRLFMRATDWYFEETEHCRQIVMIASFRRHMHDRRN